MNFGSKITSGFHWIKAQVKVTRFLYKSIHVSLDGFVTSISTYRESESYEYFPSELASTYNSFGSKFFFLSYYTIFIYECSWNWEMNLDPINVITFTSIPYVN